MMGGAGSELTSETSVVGDAMGFRVVYNRRDDPGGDVRLQRFDVDGAAVGAAEMVVPGTPPFSAFPRIATDGCNDGIAWYGVSSGSPQMSTMYLHLEAGSALP